MPSETFFCNEHPENANSERLSIDWVAPRNSSDPGVFLNHSRRTPADADGPIQPWSPLGVFELNREAINKLIRALRRARDQAYGRDE